MVGATVRTLAMPTLLERLFGIVDVRGDREILMLYLSFNRLLSARIAYPFMPRLFPTSIRDAVRPAQLCGALDVLAEAGVDAPFGAAKDQEVPGYPVPGSCERGRDCSGVPNS
jgi:hypothetical protein